MENWKRFLIEVGKDPIYEQWISIHQRSWYINLLRILSDWVISNPDPKIQDDLFAAIEWHLVNFEAHCMRHKDRCQDAPFGTKSSQNPMGRGPVNLSLALKAKAAVENANPEDLYRSYTSKIDIAANARWLEDLDSKESKTKKFFEL